jgi:hypothetical protein
MYRAGRRTAHKGESTDLEPPAPQHLFSTFSAPQHLLSIFSSPQHFLSTFSAPLGVEGSAVLIRIEDHFLSYSTSQH